MVAFATETIPALVFKSLDDIFAGHKKFIHTDTHGVKEKVK